MSELTHVKAPQGVAPGNGYSQVVWGEGRFVAISGQISLDENGDLVGAGDPAAQARQVFVNFTRALRGPGLEVAPNWLLGWLLRPDTPLWGGRDA